MIASRVLFLCQPLDRRVTALLLLQLQERGKSERSYGIYPSKIRAKIGKYTAENGVNAAARRLSKTLNRSENESTVRGMKKEGTPPAAGSGS